MASSNALVVEVVGDTTKLKRGLSDAEAQINRFAGKSKIKSTAADGLLADVRTAAVDASFGRMAAKSVVAGFALNAVGRNFAEVGGEAGKFGNAITALSSGNLVGFARAANDSKAALNDFSKELVANGDFAKANTKANQLEAAGLDELAKAARKAADEIKAVDQANRQAISFAATQGIFGVTPLDPTLGKDKKKTGRAGVSADQRNRWFDSRISREIDRVQDIRTVRGQIDALHAIAAEIEKRKAATADVTRRLNLEDQAVSVNRQARSLQDQLDADAKARADAIRKRAQQTANALKDGANEVQKGVNAFAKALKGEASGKGPLTATTSLNANQILAGLGLDRNEERALRARLSHFNSSGVALAGARGVSGQDVNFNISIDGRQVEHSVTKNQQKRSRANPPRRRGR